MADAINKYRDCFLPYRIVKVKVKEEHIYDYFHETPAAVAALISYLMASFPATLEGFLDQNEDDFNDFVLSRTIKNY